jgi:hypothetical protein
MLCDTCRFTGRPGFIRGERGRADADGAMIPCPDCGGSGVAHCCDGICEQPDLGASRNAVGVARNNSGGEETIR